MGFYKKNILCIQIKNAHNIFLNADNKYIKDENNLDNCLEN